MTSKGKLDAIYPALLAVINNVAPHICDLGLAASSKLMGLFSVMSSPDFLLSNEGNHELLKALLEAFNAILEDQYESESSFPLKGGSCLSQLYLSQKTRHLFTLF